VYCTVLVHGKCSVIVFALFYDQFISYSDLSYALISRICGRQLSVYCICLSIHCSTLVDQSLVNVNLVTIFSRLVGVNDLRVFATCV